MLFREIPGQNKRIQATYTDEKCYYGHSITPFILTDSGFNIYYNSINLSGDRDAVATTKPTSISSAIMINNSSAANLDIRNNILVNTQTAFTNQPKSYAIYSTAANTAFTNINYNDYFVSGTQGILGFLSSDRTTIAAWRTATGKDVNSFSQNPQFLSNTDLHVNTAVTSYLESAGTPIAGITTDFDGDAKPDIIFTNAVGTGSNFVTLLRNRNFCKIIISRYDGALPFGTTWDCRVVTDFISCVFY